MPKTSAGSSPRKPWPTVRVPSYDLVPGQIVQGDTLKTVQSVRRESVGKPRYDYIITWEEPGMPETRFTSEDVLDVEHFRSRR